MTIHEKNFTMRVMATSKHDTVNNAFLMHQADAKRVVERMRWCVPAVLATNAVFLECS